MRASILGLGEWLPDEIRTNEFWPPEIVARWRERNELRKEGVDTSLAEVPDELADRLAARYFAEEADDPFFRARKRHASSSRISSAAASAEAGLRALADARVDPLDVDVVMSWETVPDRAATTGAARIALLVEAHRAYALTTDSGCASPVLQMQLAAALIESGRARYVLCTQSHTALQTYPIAHPVTAFLGDAATAFVVGPSEVPGIVAVHAVSDGRYYDAVTWSRADDGPWYLEGGPIQLGSRDRERAQALIKNTVRAGALTVREVLQKARLETDDVDTLVSVHPRRWIPEAIAISLGLDPDRTPHTFDETAHTGGCCVVTNLLEARRRGMLEPDAHVAIYAQGMGFTRAGAVLRWTADG